MTQVLGYLPAIERDETLYSWCSTVHKFSGNGNSELTSLALFNNPHAARQHEVPSAILTLSQKYPRIFSDPTALLAKHTLAACYLPFLAPKTSALSLSGSYWRRELFAASRTLKIEHPLRLCEVCVKEDIERIGRAYWHVQHQYPAAFSCDQHASLLMVARAAPKRWQLPDPNLAQRYPYELVSAQSAGIAASVGSAAGRLSHIDSDALRLSTLQRMLQMGVIVSVAGARHDRIQDWFSSSEIAKACGHPLSGLAALSDGAWVPHHLWRKKRSHPARWIVLWSALAWSSPKEAADCFSDAASGRIWETDSQLGLFINALAPLATPSHVIQAFSACDSYGEVMAKLCISRSDVVRWLENDPNLRQAWRNRLRRKREQKILALARSLDSLHGMKGINEFLGTHATDLQWLKLNAPQSYKELVQRLPYRGNKQSSLF
ncbi:MAG: TniQ family protein [Burkholderiaceae bacterium]|nr:TniQ family protein [Burkholderiaceae bacterium]